MSGTPKEGEGTRNLDCDYYGACLDFSAKKDWNSFHCDDCSCPDFEEDTHEVEEEPIKKPLCNDCGKKERMGSSPYCASCMAIRGNKARAKGKQKATEGRKKQNQTKDPDRSRKATERAITALTIEFGEHVSILREIEEAAKKELRTVEYQIIHALREHLSKPKS